MKKFEANFRYRSARGSLEDHFVTIEAPSLAAAKRMAKGMEGRDTKTTGLIGVELITTNEIEPGGPPQDDRAWLLELRDEAAWAGDREQVAICERALDGDRAALEECRRVVAEARAMEKGRRNVKRTDDYADRKVEPRRRNVKASPYPYLWDVVGGVARAFWVVTDAKSYVDLLEEVNNATVSELVMMAAEADEFGWAIGMQALDHGVSWFDKHAKFDLKIPYWTSHAASNEAYAWLNERYEMDEE